jgi:ActR/RegA family two-component response regulator
MRTVSTAASATALYSECAGQADEAGGRQMPDVTSIVFVVDDDVSVRESLDLLIRAAGWQPETFASAQAFLSRARPTVPCCLVLDVTLPGLSGLELQQQLTERTDMPIIFITGHGDVPMSVQAMKAGAVEFLTKPSPTTCCWAPSTAPSSEVAPRCATSRKCECCGAPTRHSLHANAR